VSGCGHPAAAMRHVPRGPGDPDIVCDWCLEVREAREEGDAKAARVVRLFSEVAHEHPGIDWGVDAAGIHPYEPNDPCGCPVCEALDAVLGDARAIGDVTTLTDEERDRVSRFHKSGLLWLVNTAVLHPRGFALALELTADGVPIGLSVVGDGTEPWAYEDDTVQESFMNHYDTEQEREREWSLRLKGEQ